MNLKTNLRGDFKFVDPGEKYLDFLKAKRAELGKLGVTTLVGTVLGTFAIAFARGALTQEVIQSVLIWNFSGLVLGAGASKLAK